MKKKPKSQKIDFFKEVFDSLYKKTPIDVSRITSGFMIGLFKYMAQDPKNIKWFSKVVPYDFYLDGELMYYMMYFGVPKNQNKWMFRSNKKIQPDEDKFNRKLQYIFNWSNRELEYNMPLINFLNLRDKWSETIGVENG